MGLASNKVGIFSVWTNLPKASKVCRVLLTVNAGARNLTSVQETKLYAQKSVADPENFGGGDDKNFKHKTSKIRMCCNQARSQKFAMERLF